MRQDSEELLSQAEQALSETNVDLKSRLENSEKTIDGLRKTNLELEQYHAEIVFMMNNRREGMSMTQL